jgi:hypothetical protein
MILVESVPGIGGESMKESSRAVNSNRIYLIHCKNFCKYTNVPLASTIIKQNFFLKKQGRGWTRDTPWYLGLQQ